MYNLCVFDLGYGEGDRKFIPTDFDAFRFTVKSAIDLRRERSFRCSQFVQLSIFRIVISKSLNSLLTFRSEFQLTLRRRVSMNLQLSFVKSHRAVNPNESRNVTSSRFAFPLSPKNKRRAAFLTLRRVFRSSVNFALANVSRRILPNFPR